MNWVNNGMHINQVNSTYGEHYVCTIRDTPDWDGEESESILVTDNKMAQARSMHFQFSTLN